MKRRGDDLLGYAISPVQFIQMLDTHPFDLPMRDAMAGTSWSPLRRAGWAGVCVISGRCSLGLLGWVWGTFLYLIPQVLVCRGDTGELGVFIIAADEGFVKLGQQYVVSNEFYYNPLIHKHKGNRKASATKSHQRPDIVTNGTPCSYILQKKREPKSKPTS